MIYTISLDVCRDKFEVEVGKDDGGEVEIFRISYHSRVTKEFSSRSL